MIDSPDRSSSTDSFHATQSPDVLEDETYLFEGNQTGTALSALEMRSDLIKLFHYLNVNLAQYEEGSSSFLKTYEDALLYTERVAKYALYDYPRYVEGEPQITTLWEALYQLLHVIYESRTGQNSGDGQTELSVLEQIIQNTLREVTPPEALT